MPKAGGPLWRNASRFLRVNNYGFGTFQSLSLFSTISPMKEVKNSPDPDHVIEEDEAESPFFIDKQLLFEGKMKGKKKAWSGRKIDPRQADRWGLLKKKKQCQRLAFLK